MASTNRFRMNGYPWRIEYVNSKHPMLVDRTNTLTVGTTDPSTGTVYLSNRLEGGFLVRVLIHELGHCALYSFHLLDDIHRMVYPEYWVDAEEWVCNFIADYGMKIFSIAYRFLGDDGWICIPKELERWIG